MEKSTKLTIEIEVCHTYGAVDDGVISSIVEFFNDELPNVLNFENGKGDTVEYEVNEVLSATLSHGESDE